MKKVIAFASKVLDIIHQLIVVGLQEIGFVSFTDLFNQILFLKHKVMTAYVAVFSLGSGVLLTTLIDFRQFVQVWIYNPDIIFYTVLTTTVSAYVTGVLKAKYYKKEEFDLIKGLSIVPMLLSQAWALITAFHFSSNEPVMAWMAPSIAIFLFSANFLKSCYNLSLLGFFPPEFVEFLQEKFKMSNKTKSQEDESNN
jgi:hypothetical protein